MNGSSHQRWQPTEFRRFDESIPSSMCPARIITDVGPAYLKAIGNPQGPHQLACEYVGTQLAEWFGLPTFDYALMTVDAREDEIPLGDGKFAQSGPAFVTRAATGHPWGKSSEELDALINPESITHLVVFDTWTLNCDRYPPELTKREPKYDNVFLEKVGERGKKAFRLVAIDQGCCFSGGRDLSPKIANIDQITDSQLYGMFPAFVERVAEDHARNAIARLGELREDTVEEIVGRVPSEWDVNAKLRKALRDLIVQRAAFVAANILSLLGRVCWPGQLFDNNP
ncbi:MAG: HipA family kinase [Thermoguttaceae bacterium]